MLIYAAMLSVHKSKPETSMPYAKPDLSLAWPEESSHQPDFDTPIYLIN